MECNINNKISLAVWVKKAYYRTFYQAANFIKSMSLFFENS